MANVFVSYSRVSAETVEALVKDIEALGHEVWFDKELVGGQSWWDKILETIRSADIFVFVIDHSSLRSKACTREYEYADALGIPIIPIVTDPSVRPNLLPRALQMVQHVSYIDPDKEAAFRLARAFMSITAKAAPPDPLPSPPLAPMSYISEIAEKVRTSNTLDFGEQSGLFIELKNVLSEDFMNEDTLALLGEFRGRQDLLATIAKEIDDLFRAPQPVTSIDKIIDEIPNENSTDKGIDTGQNAQHSSAHKSPPDGMAEIDTPFIDQIQPSGTSWGERATAACAGAALGTIWAFVVILWNSSHFSVQGSELLFPVLFMAVPLAAVGLYAGLRTTVFGVILLCAIIGVVIWPTISGANTPEKYLTGVAFGSTIGGIVAAIWDSLKGKTRF